MKFLKLRTITLISIALLFYAIPCLGNDFKKEYEAMMSKKDYKHVLILINKWAKDSPNDPEMFIAYFNYYVNIGFKSAVGLYDTPPKGESLALNKPETNKIVGYLGEYKTYNTTDVAKGIQYGKQGLLLNPDRLDIYFGIVYILEEIKDYNGMTAELINILKRSEQNKNVWLWSDNKSLNDAKNFMIENVQIRIFTLFKLNNEESDKAIESISNEMMRIYPENLYAYNNLGAIRFSRKDFKGALILFKKAESINNTDVLVINNIARIYMNLGEKDLAIRYYQKMIMLGDDEQKEYAKQQISELQ